jgi:hypothetical protein
MDRSDATDLADAVVVDRMRSLGEALPPHGGDLAGLLARAGVRRRRRRSLGGAVVACLLVIGGLSAVGLAGRDRSGPADVGVAAGGEGVGVVPSSLHGADAGNIVVGPWVSGGTAAVRTVEAGRVVDRLALGRGESLVDAAALDDGGLVALLTRAPTGADPRPVTVDDGPDVVGVEYPLVTIGRDGRVLQTVDVRVRGEYVRLIAASASASGGEVVLRRWRGSTSSLVVRDLSSGVERPILDVDGAVMPGTLVGGRLVAPVDGGAAGCRVIDAPLDAARDRGSVRSFPLGDCHETLTLSADVSSSGGRRAAIAYYRITPARPELRLAVVDLASGTLDRDVSLDTVIGGDDDQLLGIAWNQHHHVVVAFNRLGQAIGDATVVDLGD